MSNPNTPQLPKEVVDKYKADKLNSRLLNQGENMFAHDIAIDLLPEFGQPIFNNQLDTNALRTRLREVLEALSLDPILNNPKKFEDFFNNVLRRLRDMAHTDQMFSADKVEAQQRVLSLTQAQRDKIARVLVPAHINESLTHNLRRAWHLRSFEVNLKTKEESKRPGRETGMADQIGDNQARIRHDKLVHEDALEAIETFKEHIQKLHTAKETSDDKLKELNAEIKKLTKIANQLKDQMTDFKDWPRLYEKWGKIGESFEQKRQKQYQNLCKAEDEIRAIEEKIKAIVQDPNMFVADCVLDRSYSGDLSIEKLEEFTEILMGRIAHLRNLKVTRVKNFEEETDKEHEFETESDQINIKKHRKRISGIESFRKKWTASEYAYLERLFWYQFGDKIKKIEEWQKKLPYVSRLGQSAYSAVTTAAARDYLALEGEIRNFEEENGLKGLLALLQDQLGTVALRKVFDNVQVDTAREEVRQFNAEYNAKRLKYGDLINQLRQPAGQANADEQERQRLAAEAARLEAERQAQEAARLEAERQAQEAERQRREEEMRQRIAALEAEKANLENEKAAAEQKAKDEKDRLEAEKAELERKANEEKVRLEAEKAEVERIASEEKARLEAEKFEAERKASEERARLEARMEAERNDEVQKIKKEKDALERKLAEAETEAQRLLDEKDAKNKENTDELNNRIAGLKRELIELQEKLDKALERHKDSSSTGSTAPEAAPTAPEEVPSASPTTGPAEIPDLELPSSGASRPEAQPESEYADALKAWIQEVHKGEIDQFKVKLQKVVDRLRNIPGMEDGEVFKKTMFNPEAIKFFRNAGLDLEPEKLYQLALFYTEWVIPFIPDRYANMDEVIQKMKELKKDFNLQNINELMQKWKEIHGTKVESRPADEPAITEAPAAEAGSTAEPGKTEKPAEMEFSAGKEAPEPGKPAESGPEIPDLAAAEPKKAPQPARKEHGSAEVNSSADTAEVSAETAVPAVDSTAIVKFEESHLETLPFEEKEQKVLAMARHILGVEDNEEAFQKIEKWLEEMKSKPDQSERYRKLINLLAKFNQTVRFLYTGKIGEVQVIDPQAERSKLLKVIRNMRTIELLLTRENALAAIDALLRKYSGENVGELRKAVEDVTSFFRFLKDLVVEPAQAKTKDKKTARRPAEKPAKKKRIKLKLARPQFPEAANGIVKFEEDEGGDLLEGELEERILPKVREIFGLKPEDMPRTIEWFRILKEKMPLIYRNDLSKIRRFEPVLRFLFTGILQGIKLKLENDNNKPIALANAAEFHGETQFGISQVLVRRKNLREAMKWLRNFDGKKAEEVVTALGKVSSLLDWFIGLVKVEESDKGSNPPAKAEPTVIDTTGEVVAEAVPAKEEAVADETEDQTFVNRETEVLKNINDTLGIIESDVEGQFVVLSIEMREQDGEEIYRKFINNLSKYEHQIRLLYRGEWNGENLLKAGESPIVDLLKDNRLDQDKLKKIVLDGEKLEKIKEWMEKRKDFEKQKREATIKALRRILHGWQW